MPMNKEIAGEGKWQIQAKLNIIGFTLSFQNIPWAKTNFIIANPDIIIASRPLECAFTPNNQHINI